MEELPNLLTSGGIAVVVVVIIGAIKAAAPTFDLARWGSLLAIGFGIALAFANMALGTPVADDTAVSPMATFLIGLLGGASATGIYSAGRAQLNGGTA